MELYYESMTKVVHQLEPWWQVTIRCWRHEEVFYDDKVGDVDDKNVEEIMKSLKELKKEGQSKAVIANHLIKMERMNAVEVIDQQGSGCVVYKDWP
jgi:ABC-type lipoprotein export system ATPase subunit